MVPQERTVKLAPTELILAHRLTDLVQIHPMGRMVSTALCPQRSLVETVETAGMEPTVETVEQSLIPLRMGTPTRMPIPLEVVRAV